MNAKFFLTHISPTKSLKLDKSKGVFIMNSKMQNKESLEQHVQIASSDLELLKDERFKAIVGGTIKTPLIAR